MPPMPPPARLLVLVGQAATVLLTWPLRCPRAHGPPSLPLVEGFPDIPLLAPALLLTLALAVPRPRAGAVLHALTLALAISADQTRLQPTTVSLAILLVATRHGDGRSTGSARPTRTACAAWRSAAAPRSSSTRSAPCARTRACA